MAEVVKMGPVTIELGDRKNRSFMFPITQELYRGWWKRENLGSDELVEETEALPNIPGIHITVNPRAKTVKVHDPLNEDVELARAISAAVQKGFNKAEGPMKDVTYTDLTDTEVKSWMHYVVLYVRAKKAVVVAGELPTPDQVKAMPGKTRCEPYNSSARAQKYAEDAPVA